MSRLRFLAGPFFIGAGVMHFVVPRVYRSIVPPWLPAPMVLVYASGVAEIAGGAGLLHPRSRRASGWWLIATLVGVFPANLHMALHPEQFPAVPGGRGTLVARLPLQILFIAWVLEAMATDGMSFGPRRS